VDDARRAFLIGAALLALPRGPSAEAAQEGGVQVSVTPGSPRPGDIVLLQVTGGPPDLRVEWDGRPALLYPSAGGWGALVGLDLDVRPGPIGWRVTRPSVAKNGGALAAGAVTVRSRAFPTQPLTLPKGMVDLDAATLARVETERAALQIHCLLGEACRGHDILYSSRILKKTGLRLPDSSSR